jgi:hypothetical protein
VAWALDQSLGSAALSDGGATTISVVTTATAAAGSWVFMGGISFAGAVTMTNVTGGGLGWAVVGSQQSPGGGPMACLAAAYAGSGVPSGTTLSYGYSSGNPGRRCICAASFTGGDSATTQQEDSALSTTSAATAWATGSLDPTSANGLLVAVSGGNSFTVTSTITGPSVELYDFGAGAVAAGTMAYQIAGAAGSYTIAGTWSGATDTGTVGAAYSPTGTPRVVTPSFQAIPFMR